MRGVIVALLVGCGPRAPCEEAPGCVLAEGLAAGLLSVRVGPREGDVWIVGATPEPADGSGPVLVHANGDAWERLDTSAWAGAELWWAWVSEDEAVFVGTDGLILELSRGDGQLTAIEGPDPSTTFFGVWGASADALWAVGQTDGGDGPPALWRRIGGTWSAWEDAELGPGEAGQVYFKVHGVSDDDLWIVGTRGLALRWDGARLTPVATDADTDTSSAPLLTIDAAGQHPLAVGGLGNGLVLEYDGNAWRDRSPDFQPGFNGVCTRSGVAWAVGQYGSRADREQDGTWTSDLTRAVTPPTLQDWHACAIDHAGGLWTVGGRIAARPLIEGVVGYQGPGEPPALVLD
jgi:hypothetical protein